MNETPLLLVCDHRGERVGQALMGPGGGRFRIAVAENLRESLAAIAAWSPAVVILDPLAPQAPVELQAVERARGETPLLVVADAEDPLPVVPGLEPSVAAWDVIQRGAPADEWRIRLHRLGDMTRMLSERSELAHRASHDDHTDLLRPKAFQARLAEHFSAASRHDFELALVLIDLDEFGAVNKHHDHTVGDILIAQVGEVIRRTLRAEDVAGRLGGDEFAVLLPYTGKVDAAAVVNRLCREIHKLSGRPAGAKSDIAVGASLGFETYDGTDLESLEELRLHAERALRESKVRGGNQGTYFRSLAR